MTTRSIGKRTLFTATALVALVGIGTATVLGAAHARGFGGHGGPGGCGGPGMMSQGPGGAGGFGGGPGGARSSGFLLAMDADADGTVTRAEFDRFHDLAFLAMDTNGNGAVERQAFLDARQGPMLGRTNGDDTTATNWRGGPGRFAERRAQMQGQRFDGWDKDANGTVTEAEFKATAAERFAALDLDQDGAVTKQEMAARAMFGPRGSMMGPSGR